MIKGKTAAVSYLLLAGALGACSSEETPNSTGGDGGNEAVTLRIATYLSSPDQQAALQALIDAHQAKHRDVRIELKPLILSPPGTIAQLTGEDPIEGGWDVAIHTVTSVPATLDVTLDLNTIPALASLKSRFHPSVRASIEQGGKWAGVPVGVTGFNGAIYNKDALDELGSSPPRSLAELTGICQNYIDMGKGGKLPVPIGETDVEYGPLVVMATFLRGAATFGIPASTTELVQSWRTAVGALEFFTQNDCIYLAADLNGDGSPEDESFDRTINGENALGLGPVWGLGYLIAQGQIQQSKFDYGPLIGDEAGFIYTVELVTANVDTPVPDAVADFLKVVAEQDVHIEYLRARGGTPAMLFDNPADIGDATLERAYAEFQTADAEGRAGLWPLWLLGLDKATGPLRALFDKTGTADEVIESYLCGEPRHPALETYETTEACVEAIRAIPAQ
jgi:ABC-type glycerol-3-phosphate transport system substrate-binding protein